MVQLIIPLIFLGGMMWWMTRSQKKQQQERQNQLDALKVGDAVITIGGLHGVISEINTEKGTVTLDCEGIYLEFERSSIKSSKPGVTVANDATVTKETVTEKIEETPTETTEEIVVEDPEVSNEKKDEE